MTRENDQKLRDVSKSVLSRNALQTSIFNQNQNPRSSTELDRPAYRQEPGQIGWGINRTHLADTTSTIPQIEKPHVRSFDLKQSSQFRYGTGLRRLEFDKRYGIDPLVYQIMNPLAQRQTVKALDLQFQLPKISKPLDSVPSIQKTGQSDQIPTQRSTEMTRADSNLQRTGRNEFTSMISKMSQNAFMPNANINNQDKGTY